MGGVDLCLVLGPCPALCTRRAIKVMAVRVRCVVLLILASGVELWGHSSAMCVCIGVTKVEPTGCCSSLVVYPSLPPSLQSRLHDVSLCYHYASCRAMRSSVYAKK